MMQRKARNQLFEEKSALIDRTMKRHNRIIGTFRLCQDDIRQELALRMLECLDLYDAARCPNMDAYLMEQLRYALYHQTTPSKRYGVPYAPINKDFQVVSLEEYHQTLSAGNPAAVLEIWDEIDAMPRAQKVTVYRLLYGEQLRCTNRELHIGRRRIHQRIGAPGRKSRLKKERDDHAKAAIRTCDSG